MPPALGAWTLTAGLREVRLPALSCVEGFSIYSKASKKESSLLMLKRPQLPSGFPRRFPQINLLFFKFIFILFCLFFHLIFVFKLKHA